MFSAELIGFSAVEEGMIREAIEALEGAGYDISPFKRLYRDEGELPAIFRGMTLDDGALLSERAFTSQMMLNHVMEEELLHHAQKAGGRATEFGPGTASLLEGEVDEIRKFPAPE